MKLMKVITALAALTFGVSVHATGSGDPVTTWASENFDSLTAGTALETGVASGNWATWNGGEDDTLKVIAWGDAAPTNSAGEVIKTAGASEKQTNYLKIETALTNGVTFAAGGLNTDTVNYQPKACGLGSADQIYFDSLVNLTAGEPDALSSVSMPDDGRLALWLQSVEIEEKTANGDSTTTTTTKEVNQLCICAAANGRSADADNIYTADVETVSTGWHRLTVRLFKNAARSGDAIPAMAIYLDNVAVQATTAPMTDAIKADLTPKSRLLADNNALFPSRKQTVDDVLGDVKGVQFAGTGDIDDIAFTTARPSFIDASQDLNYFHLTWDDNVASISYTVNSGDAVTIDASDKEADIALTDGKATTIAVTVSHGTDVALDANAIANASTDATSSISGDVVTFSVEAGTLTPIGAIKFASNVKTVSAKVKLGDATKAKTLDATTLADLITAINNEIGEETSGEIYITLTADQTLAIAEDEDEDGNPILTGNLSLGTAGNENIKWTLDLNGHAITASGSVSSANPVIAYVDGAVTITDTSANGNGSIGLGAFADNTGATLISVYGNLTIAKGTFDGAVTFFAGEGETPAGTGTITGGKFLASANTTAATETTAESFSLTFYLGEGYSASKDGDYWVVASGSTPEPATTYTVTFKDEKNNTSTDQTVSANDSGKYYATKPDTDPTFAGYVFMGWYAADAETAFDFTNTEITENITLTAKWAQAIAKIGDTGYATIQEALDAAVAAESATTVDIVANYAAAFTAPMTLVGKGKDVTDITINVAEGVSVSNLNREVAMMKIESAKVAFGGSGTWAKNEQDKAYMTATFFKVGESGTSSAADIIVNSGTFSAGNSKVFSIQNGTITVNGGTFDEYCGRVDTYCIRVEASANGNASATINGGTFIGGTYERDTDGNVMTAVPPVGIMGSDASATLSVSIPTSSTAKFKGVDAQITDVMVDYITKDETDENDYKFKLGDDGYYTVAAITWVTASVKWDANVTGFTATDGEESYTKPTDGQSALDVKFDVDDKMSFSITKDTITFADGYELDETQSVLGPVEMTEARTLSIVSKAKTVTPTTYDPGEVEETTYTSETDANDEVTKINDAIKAGTASISAPSDLTDATAIANYKALFAAKVVQNGTTYQVTIDFTDDATTNLQAQVDADVKKIELTKIAAAEDTTTEISTEIDTTPGLYYTVYSGSETPATLTQDGDSVFATGAATTLKFKKQGTRGFYKIGVSIKAIAKPAE